MNRLALFFLALIFLAVAGPRIWTFGFGSDELEHYTATYTWMANQMSHAMMGFCVMFVFWGFCIRKQNSSSGQTWLGRNRQFWPFLALLAKDFVFDPAKDLLATRNSPIEPNWKAVLFDSLTDDLFWFSGFCLAMALIRTWFDTVETSREDYSTGTNGRSTTREPVEVGPVRPIRPNGQSTSHSATPWFMSWAAVTLMAFVCGLFWYSQKDAFDRSEMPLNYERLALLANRIKFPDNVKAVQEETLREIQKTAENGTALHIVLYGGSTSDRRSLAVSLGCEYVFQLNQWLPSSKTPVAFLSATQLLESPEKLLQLDGLRCVVVVDLETSSVPPPDVLVSAAWKHTKPGLFSAGIRNQLDLIQFLQMHRKKVNYKQEEDLDEVDLKLLYDSYSNPENKSMMFPHTHELRTAVQLRTKAFKELGKAAKEKGIVTIWSFSETPAWLGEACSLETEKQHRMNDREAWIYTIAELLGACPESIRRIELK